MHTRGSKLLDLARSEFSQDLACSEFSQRESPIGMISDKQVKLEPTSPLIEDGTSGQLVCGAFMNITNALNLLQLETKCLDRLPMGPKENVYFLVNNAHNITSRQNGQRSTFLDDCGAWDSSKGASPKSYYLKLPGGDTKQIYVKSGQYCSRRKVKRKSEFIPMENQPTPSEVLVVHRYYTQLKKDPLYKKRATWLGDGYCQSPTVLLEYSCIRQGYR